MNIVVEKRSDDYMAYLESDKAIWGCGSTVVEAVGELIYFHPEVFNINVQNPQ